MEVQRKLTHDEKKASEAAFRGLPLNPSWTASAKEIYEGIAQALGEKSSLSSLHETQPSEPVDPPLVSPLPAERSLSTHLESNEEGASPDHSPSETLTVDLDSLPLKSRREAIDQGIMKDVTPLAQRIGLDFCVGLTNPLWEQYIFSSSDLTEEQIQTRLRDTLVAVRLRLASLKTPSPLVDVPVLLEFDPEPTPQLCLTFALFHKDPVDGDCMLLIHPGEVFATRQNSSNN